MRRASAATAPADGVLDFGARLLSAFASVVDASEPEEIDRILDGLPDPVGQFYRFSLAGSLLRAAEPRGGRRRRPPSRARGAAGSRPMTRLTIDPITRLEGHGKIEIFLDDAGRRRADLLPGPGAARLRVASASGGRSRRCRSLTNRICGVCPEAHHLAAAKAADAVYGVDPPRPAKLLRELLYCAFFVTDHTTHFYALGGPDLIVGPDAPVAERNILGVIQKVGLEVGGRVIEARRGGHRVIEIIGGRRIHPCTARARAG